MTELERQLRQQAEVDTVALNRIKAERDRWMQRHSDVCEERDAAQAENRRLLVENARLMEDLVFARAALDGQASK